MTKAISSGLKQHWTVKHGKMVAKKQFKSIDECVEYMRKKHINQSVFTPYICKDCGMWHIGHNRVYKTRKT